MKNVYFEGEIKGYPLQITNSYVLYNNEIIPVNSISYIAKRRKRYSYLSAFILLLLTIAVFVAYYFIDAKMQPIVAFVLGALAIIDFIITFIFNDRMYLLIYSHSKENIEIPLRWLQKRKLFDSVYKALIQAIEDNHSLQGNSQQIL